MQPDATSIGQFYFYQGAFAIGIGMVFKKITWSFWIGLYIFLSIGIAGKFKLRRFFVKL
jgi:hypothetical protein